MLCICDDIVLQQHIYSLLTCYRKCNQTIFRYKPAVLSKIVLLVPPLSVEQMRKNKKNGSLREIKVRLEILEDEEKVLGHQKDKRKCMSREVLRDSRW